MIPARNSFVIGAVLAALGAGAIFLPALQSAWLAVAGLAVAGALLDALLLARSPTPGVERQLPGSVSLSTWFDIHLTLRNTLTRRPVRVRIFDHFPQSMRVRALPQEITVAAGHFTELEYQCQPLERGTYRFTGTDLRLASPWGFWWSRRRLDMADEVRVYPNFSTIQKLLNYEVDNRLAISGLRLSRRRGEGIEFDQLRDYRDGDSMRAIDWKATARMSRLITREYQDERDQQVIFVLDTGRRMLTRDGDLSHFDHALNAMLLVSFVALRQGDAVGVLTTGEVPRWLAPRKGVGTINHLLNHVFEEQPTPVAIDYIAAATAIRVRQRRRALVIFLTNIREEDSEELGTAVGLLRRQHLVLVASLREKALDDVLTQPVRSHPSAVLNAATQRYLEARKASHDLLSAQGVFVEDCLSDELPAAVSRRYLAIKRAGQL